MASTNDSAGPREPGNQTRTVAAQGDGRAADPSLGVSPGMRIGKYQLQAEVGRGGMGVVYRAWDVELARTVALKLLPRAGSGDDGTDESVQRFLREARTAAHLHHPNIVAIHDVGMEGHVHYFAMDLVEGGNLADEVRSGKLSRRVAVSAIAQVCDAVHHAHQMGVIHRDLKPGNILVDAAGKPYLLDFGLARGLQTEMRLTRTGQILGTPHYMSPEQVSADPTRMDSRSDVYSLGVILYEVLVGKPPYSGSWTEILVQVLDGRPVAPSLRVHGVARDLEAVALKAMEKVPDDRYATAAGMAEDLRRYLAGEPVRARPQSRWLRMTRDARRNHRVLAVAGVSLLTLIGAYVARTRSTQAKADGMVARSRLTEDDDEAVEILTAALEIAPRSVPGYLARARRRRARGRFEAALADLDRALELDPANATARFNRMRMLYDDLHRPEDATADAGEIRRLAPASPAALGVEAMEWEGKDDRRALELMNRARALDPELWGMTYYTARILGWHLQQREAAVELYAQAYREDHSYRQGLLQCGVLLGQMGRLDDAARAYRSYAAVSPDRENVVVYNNVAAIHLQQGQLPEALAMADKAIAIREDYGSPYLLRARVRLAQGDPLAADESAARALDLDPGNETLRLGLAGFFARRSEDASASPVRQEEYRAIALAQLKRLTIGLTDWHKLAQNPELAPLHRDAGFADLAPPCVSAHLRAIRHLARREYEAALEQADEAIRLAPGYGAPHLLRACVHRARGDVDRADPEAGSALELDPSDRSLRLGLAAYFAGRLPEVADPSRQSEFERAAIEQLDRLDLDLGQWQALQAVAELSPLIGRPLFRARLEQRKQGKERGK